MTLVDTSVWVDHLRHGDTALAAALLGGTWLWTRDKRLHAVAHELGLAHVEAPAHGAPH